ncbi:MAG: hypothetical protein ABSA70_11560 [Terriglobia bacterium]
MLDEISFSSTEEPPCIVKTKKTKYSVVTYFKDLKLGQRGMGNLAATDENKLRQLELAADFLRSKNNPTFPHALCLHMVVCTRDDKLLIARRSPRLYYYPNAWSCSFEENLAPADFDGPESVTANWVRRALHEELGLEMERDYSMANARILSAFLEAEPEILNISVCGIARINLSSDELSEALTGRLRADYELTSWDYLDVIVDVKEELKKPTRDYHPTSAYRMYLTLAWYFGQAEILS